MVKKMLKLSICIPTYNRAKFLPEAIDSVMCQVTEKNKERLEICVSDNASTDSTQEIVREMSSKSQISVIYHRNEKNMGSDYNFLKVIEIAKGDFCWFLGSDDKIEKGAIDEILNVIDKNQDIALIMVDKNDYGPDLKERKFTVCPVGGGKINGDFSANGYDEIKKYISLLFDYYGYTSTQIVNKSFWDDTLCEIDNIHEYFKAFIHVYVITKMIKKHPKAIFIQKPFIGYRSGNDSFLEDNHGDVIKRCLLDINGYKQIIDELLKNWDSKIYKSIIIRSATIHIRSHMIAVKKTKLPISKKFWIWRKVIGMYWWIPSFWIKTFPFIIVPRLIYIISYKFWMKHFILNTCKSGNAYYTEPL